MLICYNTDHVMCGSSDIIYSYLPIEIAIGFSTGSRSLKSDETNGTANFLMDPNHMRGNHCLTKIHYSDDSAGA